MGTPLDSLWESEVQVSIRYQSAPHPLIAVDFQLHVLSVNTIVKVRFCRRGVQLTGIGGYGLGLCSSENRVVVVLANRCTVSCDCEPG